MYYSIYSMSEHITDRKKMTELGIKFVQNFQILNISNNKNTKNLIIVYYFY